MEANRKMLSPGTRLGDFGVTKPLGIGSVEEAYLAHDSRLGPDVAIKMIPEALSNEFERLQGLGGRPASRLR